MSIFDSAKRVFSKYDEFYEDDREYEDEYEYEDDEPKRPLFSFLNKKEDTEDAYREEPRTYQRTTRESYRSSYQKPAQTPQATPSRVNLAGVVVSVQYPESINDAVKIIREVKANKITVIDISTISADEEARRIVDYLGGAADGMDCAFKRLCPSIFCFAPRGVELELNRQRY